MKSHDAMNYLYGEFFTHCTFTCSKKNIFLILQILCALTSKLMATLNLLFCFFVFKKPE